MRAEPWAHATTGPDPRVGPADELVARRPALAHRLAGAAQLALCAVKDDVERPLTADLPTAADAEVDWHVRLVEPREHRTAVAALSDRRTRSPAPPG